jgi:hypothetical protein
VLTVIVSIRVVVREDFTEVPGRNAQTAIGTQLGWRVWMAPGRIHDNSQTAEKKFYLRPTLCLCCVPNYVENNRARSGAWISIFASMGLGLGTAVTHSCILRLLTGEQA